MCDWRKLEEAYFVLLSLFLWHCGFGREGVFEGVREMGMVEMHALDPSLLAPT